MSSNQPKYYRVEDITNAGLGKSCKISKDYSPSHPHNAIAAPKSKNAQINANRAGLTPVPYQPTQTDKDFYKTGVTVDKWKRDNGF